MAQGTIPLQKLVRGNTLLARQFSFTVNGSAPSIASARWAMRLRSCKLIYAADCTVSGGVVTRPEVSAAVTATWPVDTMQWDLEVRLASGLERTWIKGELQILPTQQ